MKIVYQISDDTNHLLLNYGPIFYVLFAIPFMWLIDRHGCRAPTHISIWLVALCNGMRLFANDASALSLVLIHVSFILNAIAGPVAMALPTKLAEDWHVTSCLRTSWKIILLALMSVIEWCQFSYSGLRRENVPQPQPSWH